MNVEHLLPLSARGNRTNCSSARRVSVGVSGPIDEPVALSDRRAGRICAGSVWTVDIDEFYDGDPRRRTSKEIAYGVGWAEGAPPKRVADLFWVADTGELYLMFEPIPPNWLPLISHDDMRRWVDEAQDLAAGAIELVHDMLHPHHHLAKTESHHPDQEPGTTPYEEQLIVEVLGVLTPRAEVDARLEGWEAALRTPDSIGWLRERVQ